MGYSDYFDLIAEVIRSGIDTHSFINADVLSDDLLDKINQEIKEMLAEKIGYSGSELCDKFLFDSETREDIIKWCRKRNDKYIYIYLLRQFDRMINLEILCSEYGMEQTAHRNREALKAQSPKSLKGQFIEPSFGALNTNVSETGIVLLPNLRNPSDNDDENEEAKEIARMSELNDVLHHFSYYETKDFLPDYQIKNVILDPGQRFEQLTVGFTPTMNADRDEAFEIGEDIIEKNEDGHDCKYIGEILLREKESSTANFIRCLEHCRQKRFGILMGTEMFGTEALCGSGAAGINPIYLDEENVGVPFLIVTPSLWKDASNSVFVFTAGGELIGTQYKQFSFTYRGEKKEHLKNIPREILLVHVRGLGKFAFPICYDLLHKEYRSLLINKLKTDFLMCPSYSSESIDFEKAVFDAASAGSYVFWLNSCSAVAKDKSKPIGAALIPSENSENAVKKIYSCACQQRCGTCLFSITVPVKREGRLGQVKGSINVEHVIP